MINTSQELVELGKSLRRVTKSLRAPAPVA